MSRRMCRAASRLARWKNLRDKAGKAVRKLFRFGRRKSRLLAQEVQRHDGYAFFPSRQIGLYMAKLFLVRTFAVLLMLVLILANA